MVGQLEPQHTHGTRSARATAHAALPCQRSACSPRLMSLDNQIKIQSQTRKKNHPSRHWQMQGMGKEEKAAGDEAMGAQLQRRIIEVLRKRKAGATC